jgi:Putative beta-barrel porin 2
MRHHFFWLLLPAVALSAAEDGLANFVYLNDRLELHPRVGVGARYDSNVDAVHDNPEDEFAAIGLVGGGLSYAWSEVTTLTADGEARMVVTDRPEQRWRNQGAFNLGAQRQTPDGNLAARVAYGRSDEPDEQTGERLLVDTWNAALTGDHTGHVHRLSGGVLFDRSDYQDSSREFGEDDRDANTYSLTAGYGLRLESGDELSLRAIVDLRAYDHARANNQDSTGTHALIGWNRQVSETVGLSIEAGVEYRRYESTDTAVAEDVLSPTWLVNGSTVTANESTWSLTLSGGVEDTIGGNPALGSRANLGWKRPLTPTWTVQAYAEGFNLRDLESVSGQPKDETWTIRGVLGASHVLRPGLSAEIDGGYEYSDSDLEGDYSRMVVQVGMTARF